MNPTSTFPISIKFQSIHKQKTKTIRILDNRNISKLLFDFTEGKIFAICCDDNKILVPVGINLVAKRSSQDSSMTSIFYFDQEIICTRESPVIINLKRIGKNFNFDVYNNFNSFTFL